MPIKIPPGWADDATDDRDRRIAELEEAARECSSRLSTLSMAFEGCDRAQICLANNFLLRALGRAEHAVASNCIE